VSITYYGDIWSIPQCVAGSYKPINYNSTSSSCQLCSAGSYSASEGAVTCTPCPANTYMNASITGSTSVIDCVACPTHFNSSLGSTSCTCSPGYYSIDNTCYLCDEGYQCSGKQPTID
jgi:hypothetical protein